MINENNEHELPMLSMLDGRNSGSYLALLVNSPVRTESVILTLKFLQFYLLFFM